MRVSFVKARVSGGLATILAINRGVRANFHAALGHAFFSIWVDELGGWMDGVRMNNSPGVWCRSSAHESQHFIVDGKPACSTAKLDRWDAWRLVMPDEVDLAKQCTRCRGHLPAVPPAPAPTPAAIGAPALVTVQAAASLPAHVAALVAANAAASLAALAAANHAGACVTVKVPLGVR